MEERLENNNGKCFDKKRCGLIQIFKNFWSPFITRLNADDSKLFVGAGMCLQPALQTPGSPGWGPGGECGVGGPAALGGFTRPSSPPVPKMSPSEHGWAVLHAWDLSAVTRVPS